MVKNLNPNGLAKNKNCSVEVMCNRGCTTEDLMDFVKPHARKTPDLMILHTGTNDLTKHSVLHPPGPPNQRPPPEYSSPPQANPFQFSPHRDENTMSPKVSSLVQANVIINCKQ